MPDDVSLDSRASLARDELHIVPPLDRLMGLRNTLVALKGPLSSEPAIQENLHRRLFANETNFFALNPH